MVLSIPPPVQSKVVTPLLEQIAAELVQDQNLVRIKKLLLYVCTGTWENNQQRLAHASLNALLYHLFEVCPTFEQLQQRLNQVVSSLNKSAEYTIVANAVIGRFRAVYAQLEQDQPTANQNFYAAVVEQLQQETDLIRIKKLLLLTCRSTWDNNSKRLARLNLLDLVQELHQIAPTPSGLAASLTQVARALSKPEEYTKIAEIISHAFQNAATAFATESTTDDEKTLLSDATEWLPTSPVDAALEIAAPEIATSTLDAAPDQPTCALSYASQNGGQPLQPDPMATELVPASGSSSKPSSGSQIRPSVGAPVNAQVRVPSAQPTTQSAISQALVLTQPQKITDLFNLRLELMQDTNPLRAKILLFSLLHERFQGTPEHDAFLRTHELDDLLRGFFLSYRLYSDAEAQLRQTAKSLAASIYLQVTEAILRSIQPFYTEVEPTPNLGLVAPNPPAPVTPTEITSMKADTNEVTLPEHS